MRLGRRPPTPLSWVRIYEAYLSHRAQVDNWDLVDLAGWPRYCSPTRTT